MERADPLLHRYMYLQMFGNHDLAGLTMFSDIWLGITRVGAYRFEVRLVLGASLSAADLVWLQAALAGAGLLECCASFHLVCTEAALSSSFRQVCCWFLVSTLLQVARSALFPPDWLLPPAW